MVAHRSRRLLFLSVFVLLLFRQGVLAEDAGSAPYTFRAGTAEVRLTFAATDQYGRNLTTLQPADFAVVDDGMVIRDFRSFNRLAEFNLNVVVLVDASGSVARRFQQEMENVLRVLSDASWGPDDRVSVLTFGGGKCDFVCVRNCHTASPAAQLSRLQAGGLTPLFDALRLGVQLATENRSAKDRPVLVAFTDGEDTISIASEADVEQAAQRSQTQIYTIDLNPTEYVSPGSLTLRRMSSATGGRNFSIGEGAATALGAVFADARAAYVVTYALPDHAEGLHSVRILPTHDLNLHFSSRRAYYYDGNQ